ncbi:MAG: tRNA (adenosine(37)-N6)-threonylcarbamoyltransferase complex ATPase subunit type 1 TsaE [Bacillota bacterium]|mgnify:FL=1|nr:tRNA (adenosine(37)-N6)-threonylcarbamoyltransferase complex ATPase subunit type 1 TsaE [Bacillota bacterium]HOA55040.1 tRNA (adenosine(37)-N6)-threonylcarbamoyltransferase complex ATPase subunit type 1 TsaE [Clostridiales bacterium]HQD30473.1 tRNA (adenosine(37)-N6)-threonylcarbamoyltransferase complex ATPase subunit type 1 TsaE [Clostridiales bacterium]
MMKFRTDSADDTAELGRKLGSMLQRGDNVCLIGDLGSGKTAFTGGLAKGLGISGYITSPTFTIVNEYEGRLPLYHFDVYRISDVDEMPDTGYYEYIDGDGVTVIEWADLIKEILPSERIEVHIEKNDQVRSDSRTITIRFIGERTAEYERRLAGESTCG